MKDAGASMRCRWARLYEYGGAFDTFGGSHDSIPFSMPRFFFLLCRRRQRMKKFVIRVEIITVGDRE